MVLSMRRGIMSTGLKGRSRALRSVPWHGMALTAAVGAVVAVTGCGRAPTQPEAPTRSTAASESVPTLTEPTDVPTEVQSIVLEAETSAGAEVKQRGKASSEGTALLYDGEQVSLRFELSSPARYTLAVSYSNDGPGTTLEQVEVFVDDRSAGGFAAQNTRPPDTDPGEGWNVFATSPPLGTEELAPGSHTVDVRVTGGDEYGVEIDSVTLSPA